MKPVFKIFIRDLKKIFTNSMAIILTVGVLVLPSLYAWFNIYANWDPYGKASTGNMQIAVINEDEGYTYKELELNVGKEIVTSLSGNDTINWQFVSKADGINGVEAGRYYAAIEIPSGFSKSMTSIVSSQFKTPEITYYANEKKNAIATKITDKVVQTVQGQVNESFITTVVNIVDKLLGTVIEEAQNSDTGTVATIQNQIKSAKSNIATIQSTVDSFQSIMKIAQDLDSSLSDQSIKKVLTDANKTIKSTQDVITVTKASVSSVTSSLDSVLGFSSSSLSDAAKKLNGLGKLSHSSAVTALTDVANRVNEMHNRISTTVTALEGVNNALPTKLSSLTNLINNLKSIDSKLQSLSSTISTALNSGNASGAISTVASQLNDISGLINSSSGDYRSNVKPALDKSVNSLLEIMTDVSNIITALSSSKDINTISATLNDSITAGSDMVTALSTLLKNCTNQLDDLSKKIQGLSDSELVNTVYNLTVGNADELGDFIACPVTVNTEKVYGIENYGSAMAPFYTTLAIWVGAIILIAIFKPTVRHKKELGKVNSVQSYFGRGLTFVCFALIQGLIICLGDLYFLKIQCYHPFLFILASCAASLVFSMFMYSLASAFGDIGKAVAVILLVIQLGGSGGTFPIDVTPAFFRMIHPYLPFTFVINAMRECVCGTYGNDYWFDLLKLSAYIAVSLVIGLVFRFVFKKPIKFFNKKIEETELL